MSDLFAAVLVGVVVYALLEAYRQFVIDKPSDEDDDDTEEDDDE